MKIGIDTLGGDFPENNVLGAIQSLDKLTDKVRIVLIGNREKNEEIIKNSNCDVNCFDFVHSIEVIGTNEHPTKAIAKKVNSTINLGYKLLKNKEIDVFCSIGNTGAMLVGAMMTVKTIPSIIRPCITSIIPQENGKNALILDVGTNADCKSDVLYQFGILGTLYAKYVLEINNPRVGLLNIGEEKEKGNLLTQATHELMFESNDFNFIGNIEGRDLLCGKADVFVCDGFTGNILLKEAEAFYSAFKNRNLKDSYFERFNYELYGGTPILGIDSNVVIGHGISTPTAIENMLILSKNLVEAQLTIKIKKLFYNE